LKKKYSILLVVAVVIIGLDQTTKTMITDKFRLGESLPIIQDFFNLTYVRNQGAAFGMLAKANPAFRVPFFIFVPLIALISIAVVFRKLAVRDVKFAYALSLVVAGAVGNLIDRIKLGYVVDFLDFHWRGAYHFPAFNIADSAICVGVGLIMLDLICFSREEKKKMTSEKGSELNVSRAH
jgi:signal peptidase II